MDEAMLQAYARLTMHEFVMEVMMANWLARISEEEANEFLESYLEKSMLPWSRDGADVDDPATQQVMRDSALMAERFADKVEKRASEIRVKLSQHL